MVPAAVQGLIVPSGACAMCAVLQRVLPQYDLMNVDTLPESFPQDAFYEFSRAFEGRAFNGALCHLSPATLQLLRSLPHVVSIDQDFLVTPSAVVTQQNAPWHLDRIDSHPRTYDSRFSYQSNGRGIDIYIIDTGIKTKHTEFTGRIMPGRNFDPGFASTDVEDCYGHGTHVAGMSPQVRIAHLHSPAGADSRVVRSVLWFGRVWAFLKSCE